MTFPMQKIFFCFVAGVAVLCVAPQVPAQEIRETFTGTIIGGQGATDGNPANDVLDLFGGGNLTGDSYVASYVFATNLGSVHSSGCSPARASCPTGTNTLNGLAPVVVSETLTINGHSFSFPAGTVSSGQKIAFNNGPSDPSGIYIQVEANDVTNSLRNDLSLGSSAALPASLVQPFSYTVTSGDGHDPNFTDSFFQYVAPGSGCPNCDRFEFGESNVNVTPVPEPSTYLLMLSGIGILLWWRRRSAPAVAMPSAA